MSNLAIGVVNLADRGTLTAGAADPDYPAANAQLPEIGTPARMATSDALTLVLGADTVISRFALAIIKHNMTPDAGGSLTLQKLDTTETLSGSLPPDAYGFWSSKIDGQSRNIALYLYDGAPLTVGRAIVTLSDGSNPDGYIEVPRLFFGELIVPAIGFAYDWNMLPDDPSERGESAGSNMVHRRRVKRRILSCELKSLQEAEAWDDYFEAIDMAVGKTRDCLVIPLPPVAFPSMATRLHQRVLWGPQNDVGALGNPRFKRYSKQISFRERT